MNNFKWILILGFLMTGLALGQSMGSAEGEASKLKILSLEDVKKWTFQMTRKDIDKIVSSEAVLLATMHSVVFKAKEGGAYNVDFIATKGKPFPYRLYSIYYLPKYPDIDPHHLIMKDSSETAVSP